MKLVNKTRWNSAQVKALIRAVAEKELLTPDNIKRLYVTMKYRKRSRYWDDVAVTGWGTYHAWNICLKVVRGVTRLDKVQMAKTIAHELAHNQGVRHGGAMRGVDYGWAPGWREKWAWANDFPITLNAELVPVQRGSFDAASNEMQHCQKMITLWERKTKLARTKMRKWAVKLKYYEKKMAAMTPAHEAAVKQVEQVMKIVEGSDEVGKNQPQA